MAIEDFDDILPHVGSFGAFQKRILLLSLPVNYFLAVVYMAQIYQTLVSRFLFSPRTWCISVSNVGRLTFRPVFCVDGRHLVEWLFNASY